MWSSLKKHITKTEYQTPIEPGNKNKEKPPTKQIKANKTVCEEEEVRVPKVGTQIKNKTKLHHTKKTTSSKTLPVLTKPLCTSRPSKCDKWRKLQSRSNALRGESLGCAAGWVCRFSHEVRCCTHEGGWLTEAVGVNWSTMTCSLVWPLHN